MSSTGDHDPDLRSPAERRLQWQLDADIRRAIHIGMGRYGNDEFLAYLSLPGTLDGHDPDLDEFEYRYWGSFDSMKQLCDHVLRGYQRAGITIHEYTVESSANAGDLEIDYDALERDVRAHLRIAEMGGRLHAFLRG